MPQPIRRAWRDAPPSPNLTNVADVVRLSVDNEVDFLPEDANG
jgi:hypothetical protein